MAETMIMAGHVARLADIQFLRNYIDDNDILCKLVAALDGLHSYNSPFEKLVALVGQTLSRIQDEALENAIDKIIRPTPQRNHAEMLARALFREPGRALYNLRIVLIELTHLIDQNLANHLLDMLRGIWVQAEAAVNLKNARNDDTAVAINCSQLEYFTGRCYARRAWPFPTKIKCIPAGPARTFAQVESVLLQEFGKAIPDRRRAKMRLKNWQKNNCENPILLMFPAPESVENGPSEETFPDQALLDDLRQNYPKVTVLLGTGSEIPDSLSYVIPLRPLLPEGEEEYQYEIYEDLLDYIWDLPL